MGIAKLPEGVISTAQFELVVYLRPDGTTGYAYGRDGSRPIVIGYLTTLLDMLRKEELDSWADDAIEDIDD